MKTLSQIALVLSAVAAATSLFAGCAPGSDPNSTNEVPDDTNGYPAINPTARTFKAGPVLATTNDTARKQRLDYHRKVVDLHKFSYTLSEVSPSHRELKDITGFLKSSNGSPAPKVQAGNVPDKWDWRGQGVPPIRDQGQCGSCWAFGTTAVVESAVGIFGKKSVDLSEQFVVDCNQNQFSCDGGDWSFEMYSKPQGGVLESDYPYHAQDGSCKGAQVQHPYVIDSYKQLDNPTVDEMKTAIYTYGVVGVSMAVCGSFPGYTDGVYDSTECNGEQRNHIVSLVGYDDTVVHSKGKGVWILRNSWGTSWGDQGYAKVAYNVAGIGADVTYVTYNGSGGGGTTSSSGSGSGSGSGSSGAGGSGAGGGDPSGSGSGSGSGVGGSCDTGSGVGVGSGSGTSGSGASCAHSPCNEGVALDGSCDPLVTQLCASDDYCCSVKFDWQCTDEYSKYGGTCN